VLLLENVTDSPTPCRRSASLFASSKGDGLADSESYPGQLSSLSKCGQCPHCTSLVSPGRRMEQRGVFEAPNAKFASLGDFELARPHRTVATCP